MEIKSVPHEIRAGFIVPYVSIHKFFHAYAHRINGSITSSCYPVFIDKIRKDLFHSTAPAKAAVCYSRRRIKSNEERGKNEHFLAPTNTTPVQAHHVSAVETLLAFVLRT